tara:strand:- start:1981 stop:2181 length:201 start_codon:yes stop_codon:yes gene_type:complete
MPQSKVFDFAKGIAYNDLRRTTKLLSSGSTITLDSSTDTFTSLADEIEIDNGTTVEVTTGTTWVIE